MRALLNRESGVRRLHGLHVRAGAISPFPPGDFRRTYSVEVLTCIDEGRIMPPIRLLLWSKTHERSIGQRKGERV